MTLRNAHFLLSAVLDSAVEAQHIDRNLDEGAPLPKDDIELPDWAVDMLKQRVKGKGLDNLIFTMPSGKQIKSRLPHHSVT